MYRHVHLKNSHAIVKRHQHPGCAWDGCAMFKITLEMSEAGC